MKYDPKEAIECLPEGQYEATVTETQESVSKKGDPMIVVTLTIYKPTGGEKTIKDWIVAPWWKLKKLAKACGRLAEFEGGEFRDGQYVGSTLMVDLEVESSDKYGDQNRVVGYAPVARTQQAQPTARSAKAAAQASSVPSIGEDDIPF